MEKMQKKEKKKKYKMNACFSSVRRMRLPQGRDVEA